METEVKKSDLPVKLLVNFCRIILGAVFLFSGVVKAIDPVGTQIKLSDYLMAFGMGFSILDSTLLILACLLAGFEILIGSYLLIGAFSKGTSFVTLLMMAVLTPFTLYLALTNPVSDCGCFGDALVLTNWQTFGKNVFLLLLAIILFIKRKAVVPFVSSRRQWIITIVMVLVSLRFMNGNIKSLPVLDFRPYKIGTNLREEIFEKRNPEIHDFSIMDDEMRDLTMRLLSDTNYTFLLVSPHLEDACENNVDLIDDVFDYCEHWGYDMIGLTASGSDAITEWVEDAGADISFLGCDEVPLQTMVRSNPGLVLIKDGVIINKWSDASIPPDDELSAPLHELKIGQIPDPDPMRTPWAVALLFLGPLALVALIDLLKNLIQ